MAPFRPANLNKRAYPGNANVIGPTRQATIGFTTTTCNTYVSNICGAATEVFTLGCRCTINNYPYCHCCCCCTCTVCTRTIPSGIWSASEQYEARTRDAWSASSCSNTAPIGYCSACCGTLTGCPGNDCKGFYICCGPTTNKWFVAPSCTQVARNWYFRDDAVIVANSCMGSCGWFVPTGPQLQNPGYSCRSYWDSYTSSWYWSSTEQNSLCAWRVYFLNGNTYVYGVKSSGQLVRAFRCTAT